MRSSTDLVQQLRECGYATVALPAVCQQAIDATFEAGMQFFNAAASDKLACRLPLDCGYRAFGTEYSVSSSIPDALDSFTVSDRTRTSGEMLLVEVGRTLHRRMSLAFDMLEQVADQLVQKIARDAGGPNVLPARILRRWSRLQLNRAQPLATQNHYVNELHEDGHFLTIAKSTGPGLEVKCPDGTFQSPTVAGGDGLIMPGQIAELMTGGKVRPLYHRVRKLGGQDNRMALLFFADITPEYCEPWIRSEVNADVDVAERVRSNSSRFGVRDFPVE